MRRAAIISVVTGLCVVSSPLSANQASARLRAQGDEHEMNLRIDQALSSYQKAVGADSTDPAAYRALAAAYLFKIASARGAVTIDEFLGGDATEDTVSVVKPPAELAMGFHTNANKALSLAEQRAAARPTDADAHFQLGSTIALLASYAATVDGQVFEAFKLARRAYKENTRALELDEHRQDAALILGLYQYIVSMRSLAVRWMARVGGIDNDKSKGIAMVESAARYPGETQTDAQLALLLIYNRERHYNQALAVLKELQSRYPNNRLLWLEGGSTMLRAGRYQDADRMLDEGFVKLIRPPAGRAVGPARGRTAGVARGGRMPAPTRGRTAAPARGSAPELTLVQPELARVPMFGEEALWFYKRGAALVGLRRDTEAAQDLKLALSKDAREWVHGRAHTEVGKIADRAGDRRGAHEEYLLAVRLAKSSNDSIGLAEAEHLLAAR